MSSSSVLYSVVSCLAKNDQNFFSHRKVVVLVLIYYWKGIERGGSPERASPSAKKTQHKPVFARRQQLGAMRGHLVEYRL